MKTLNALLLGAAVCGVLTLGNPVFAQGTAFTYQGQLQANGSPANGSYNLAFSLFANSTGGTAMAVPFTNDAVNVSNGLFTVTVDFGSNALNGAANWLQIDVATNGGSFNPLTPRQQLTPAPYAIYAENANSANLNGTYGGQVNFDNGANNFDGTFSGQFFGVSFIGGSFTGDFIGSGSGLDDVWHTTGNSGTTAGTDFLGTTDDQPLELHVDGVRAGRWEPVADIVNVSGTVNVIQGSSANVAGVGVHGAAIGGGGAINYFGTPAGNNVGDNYGTIAGGVNNSIGTNTPESTIGGGNANFIQPGSTRSTISGGWDNGIWNNAPQSFIGGGIFNRIFGDTNRGGDSVISGGYENNIFTNADYSVIGGGLFNNIYGDTNDNGTGTIAGGYSGTINSNSWNSAIGGGDNNQIGQSSPYSTVAGGVNNVIQSNSVESTIAGGGGNSASGQGVTITGGIDNQIQNQTQYSTIGGGFLNQIQSNADDSTIAGGLENLISTNCGSTTIGGGSFNQILSNAFQSVIAGGFDNQIQTSSSDSTISGGVQNYIFSGSSGATIGGGSLNQILTNASISIIAGGEQNLVQTNAFGSAIGGGAENTNTGSYATIPGGIQNVAANNSFAAGQRAKAIFQGDFVWADSQTSDFSATAVNQVSFRCGGGVIFTSGSGALNQTVSWVPGTGAWSFTSDRNTKENFKPVDAQAILEKVAQLPLSEWNYIGYDDRHVGPMAQDFHAAFPFNSNDKMINSADEAGVSLAAIQGLNEKVDELKSENTALKERLDKMEQLLNEKNGGNK